eukprot:243408-Prymnesium_polylepis.3
MCACAGWLQRSLLRSERGERQTPTLSSMDRMPASKFSSNPTPSSWERIDRPRVDGAAGTTPGPLCVHTPPPRTGSSGSLLSQCSNASRWAVALSFKD